MSMIYQRANKVHVWLGPASPEDRIPTVFAALKILALDSMGSAIPSIVPTLENESYQAVLRKSLDSFLTRPWYNRRWVLQEVKYARTLTVHCGEHRLSWDWIRDGIALLQDLHASQYADHPDMLISVATARALEGLGSLRFYNRDITDIFGLLWEYHSSNCRDERDRIFALYGLLLPPTDEPSDPTLKHFDAPGHCPIDYRKSFSETYIQLAIAGIESGRGPILFHHTIMFGSLMQQNPSWPSWMPAWNETRKTRHREDRRSMYSNQSIKVDTTRSTPLLELYGPLFPIVSVETAGETANVMDFFSAADWPLWEDELAPLLSQAIKPAGRLDGRSVINTAAIVPESDWDDIFDDEVDILMACLRKELGTPAVDDRMPTYSPTILREEVRKVLEHLPLFRYSRNTTLAPGIAFAKVEAGDFQFWLEGPDSPLSYALVLRKVELMGKGMSSPNTFRLVGCCLGPMGFSHFLKHPHLMAKFMRQGYQFTTIKLM